MASMTSTRRIVIPGLSLAVASAALGVLMLASSPTSSAMPVDSPGTAPNPTATEHIEHSADMPGMDMSGSTPTPTTTHADDGEMPSDMPGMDGHGTSPTAEPDHTSAPSEHGEDMPGMDMPAEEHGSGDTPESGHGAGDAPGSTPGHGDTEEVAQDRPLAPVLGTFGGGASAVLLTAGLMRRKDRAANAAKQAARAARRSAK